MKLFKKSQEMAENRPVSYPSNGDKEERLKSVDIPKSHFGNKVISEPIGSFGAAKTVMTSSFPVAINSMREEAILHQEGGYHLMILLKELSALSEQDDFFLIMDKWGSALAKEISNSCQMLSDEQRFDVIITYLNQILIHKRMGVFQCTIKEAEKAVVISYYFSKFDYLLLANFGEPSCVALYSAFFKNLMTTVAESVFEIKSIEASDEFWRFTLKA